jgi:magnesium-transporting ATPase (P-type)
LAFTCLTAIQLMHPFLAKSGLRTVFHRHVFSNRWLLFGVASSIILLAIGNYAPGLNDVLGQKPLAAKDWGKIIAGVVIHYMLMEIVKAVIRYYYARKDPKSHMIYTFSLE